MATENKRMRQLTATEAAWQEEDPSLLDGEIALSSDTKQFKVGPGTWSTLGYWSYLDAPADGFVYGRKNNQWETAISYEHDFTGSLNDIPANHVGMIRLTQPLSDIWDGGGTLDNSYLMQMDDGDNNRIQVGYGWSDNFEGAAVLHTRVQRAGVWTEWLAAPSFLEDTYDGDLDLLAASGRSYSLQVMVLATATNGWPGMSLGDVVTSINRGTDTAMQIGYGEFEAEDTRFTWMRNKTSGVWTTWRRQNVMEADIVDLDRTRWRGPFVQGTTYEINDETRSGAYLAEAIIQTQDDPRPQQIIIPAFRYAGATPTNQVSAKQVITGMRYTGTVGRVFNITGFRVNTVLGNKYVISTIDDPLGVPVVTQVADFTATTTGWLNLPIDETFIVNDAVMDIVAIIAEPDGTPETTTGVWDYETPQNIGTPGVGEISHGRSAPDTMRIHKTPISGAADVSVLTPGDIITHATSGLEWSIQSTTDSGAYMTFVVAPAQTASAGNGETFEFDTVSATPITYVDDFEYWAATPTIQGIYGADIPYLDIVPTSSQHNIDLYVGEVTLSSDWEIKSVSGSGASSPPAN